MLKTRAQFALNLCTIRQDNSASSCPGTSVSLRPPLKTIQEATVNATALLGGSDRVGTLEHGKFADIVAVQGDPVSREVVLNVW